MDGKSGNAVDQCSNPCYVERTSADMNDFGL